MILKGFCIQCGNKINFNPNYPYCERCGGTCSSCSRSSPSFQNALYCHKCGNMAYVSEDNPICDECDTNHLIDKK